jgi:hypothetical protein
MKRASFSIGGVISWTPGPTRITSADQPDAFQNLVVALIQLAPGIPEFWSHRDAAYRGRFSLRVAPWLGGGIVAAATAWRSSSKQFWGY